jgi:hypothetical protein
MAIRSSEEARALVRVRWGDRSRAADRALDCLEEVVRQPKWFRPRLMADQVSRLQRLAADVGESESVHVP